jgi:hypothetical protein
VKTEPRPLYLLKQFVNVSCECAGILPFFGVLVLVLVLVVGR